MSREIYKTRSGAHHWFETDDSTRWEGEWLSLGCAAQHPVEQLCGRIELRHGGIEVRRIRSRETRRNIWRTDARRWIIEVEQRIVCATGLLGSERQEIENVPAYRMEVEFVEAADYFRESASGIPDELFDDMDEADRAARCVSDMSGRAASRSLGLRKSVFPPDGELALIIQSVDGSGTKSMGSRESAECPTSARGTLNRGVGDSTSDLPLPTGSSNGQQPVQSGIRDHGDESGLDPSNEAVESSPDARDRNNTIGYPRDLGELADALLLKGHKLESAFVRHFQNRKVSTMQELIEAVCPGEMRAWGTVRTWATRVKLALYDTYPKCPLSFKTTIFGYRISRNFPEEKPVSDSFTRETGTKLP